MFNANGIPEDMRNESRWVMWRYEERNGKQSKVPYSPCRTDQLKHAKSSDPATWSTLQQAIDSCGKFNMNGLGFVLTGKYTGIDLDHVRNKDTGELTREAQDILSRLNTYAEFSPSGTGVHIITRSDYENTGKCRSKLGSSIGGTECPEIEIYTKNSPRYFTVTGNCIGSAEIADCTTELRAVMDQYLPEHGAITTTHTSKGNTTTAPTPRVPSNDNTVGATVSDENLDERAKDTWDRIKRSKDADIIRALAGGDTSKHDGDMSSADMALVKKLACWANCDSALIDHMYRQTAMYLLHTEDSNGTPSLKWDKRHYANGDTYGEHTIQQAIEYVQSDKTKNAVAAFSECPANSPNTGGERSSSSHSTGRESATTGVNLLATGKTMTKSEYGLNHYCNDAKVFAQFKDRKTVWAPLNEKHGPFLPGLYTIGAVTSLGKTTFCLQLADYLVLHEKCHVLYFSLEQSAFELYTKGLARATFQQEIGGYKKPEDRNYCAPLAVNFRYGIPEQLKDMGDFVSQYNQHMANFTIVDCGFSLTPIDVKATVEAYIKGHPTAQVVVFLDYIQALLPTDPRMSERQAVDDTVRTLKQLNRDYPGLTIVAVSSINRAAYLQPINMESFKESGGVEFTSDVVWGLELGIMSDPFFRKGGDKEMLKKRETLDAAKKANPREVRLRCLKNRNGEPTYQCPFYYYPAHDFFYALESKDLDCDGEYPVTAQNHWRGQLDTAPTVSQVEPQGPQVIGKIWLDPSQVVSMDAHFARKLLRGVTPPKDRGRIESLKPADARAALCNLIGEKPRYLDKYSDCPDIEESAPTQQSLLSI